MSIIVKDNIAILKYKCNKKEIPIYKIVNGQICINKRFNVLYSSFWNVRPKQINSECTSRVYILPDNPVTYLSGITDPDSGYVNFKSITPISSENSVINEGIALQFFRSPNSSDGTNILDPFFHFEYEIIDGNDCKVDVYSFVPGNEKIRLFVDIDNNLSQYNGSKGNFTIGRHNFIYFKYSGGGVFNLKVTAIPPVKFSPCKYNEKECIKIKDCGKTFASILYYNKLNDRGFYNLIPAKQWENIYNLIRKKYDDTALPIPLAPINIKASQIINLIADTKYSSDPSISPPEGLYLPSRNFAGNITPYNSLWSSLRWTISGTDVKYYPHFMVNIDGVEKDVIADIAYSDNGYTVTPVAYYIKDGDIIPVTIYLPYAAHVSAKIFIPKSSDIEEIIDVSFSAIYSFWKETYNYFSGLETVKVDISKDFETEISLPIEYVTDVGIYAYAGLTRITFYYQMTLIYDA